VEIQMWWIGAAVCSMTLVKGSVSDNYSRSIPVSTKVALSRSHYYRARRYDADGGEWMVSLIHGIIKYKYRYSYMDTDKGAVRSFNMQWCPSP